MLKRVNQNHEADDACSADCHRTLGILGSVRHAPWKLKGTGYFSRRELRLILRQLPGPCRRAVANVLSSKGPTTEIKDPWLLAEAQDEGFGGV